MLSQKTTMPTPDAALPGRAAPLHTDEVHYVSGRPLKGPHPEGFQTAVFGVAIYYSVMMAWFLIVGRHKLILSPEEEFAVTKGETDYKTH